MIRNAILGLFLLILAFPAVAQPLCHQDVPPAAEDCHQTAPAHHDAPDESEDQPELGAKAQHVCIGCVAPTRALAAPDAITLPAIAYAPLRLAKLVSDTTLPAIPPPKS